jgi:IS4 transposase
VPARAAPDRGVRPGEGRDVVFLTNRLTFGATTIAAIYQDRWQIELFFKALKQNLKIKTFVGTSADALKVQVWTALMPCCSSSTNHS